MQTDADTRARADAGRPSPPERMSRVEWRAGVSLSGLFALRMLGLFLILPVFAVHAREHLAGGGNALLVGLAMSAYGLTQGILQIPFGMASDRYGRKRVIVFGLALFALGSFVAAAADSIHWVVVGRVLQGAGAISAAVVAFLADLTREEHRTKVMAMVGGSIGVVFALSLVVAPALYARIGMGGIFALTGVLAIAGILVTWKVVPAETVHVHDPNREVRAATLGDVLADREMLRLNFGIFVLHAMQIALFVVLPVRLIREGGMAITDHWKIYLPVVVLSFVFMLPAIIAAERHGRMKLVFIGSIVAMAAVQFGLWLGGSSLLGLAFCGLLDRVPLASREIRLHRSPATGLGGAGG